MMREWLWMGGMAFVMVVMVGSAEAQNYDEDYDDLPLNTLGTSTGLSGLTGLVTTATAHTLPPWHAAISGAATYMQQDVPDQTMTEARTIVALGLPGQVELAAMVPGMRFETASQPPLPTDGQVTGLGDLTVASKWRLVNQLEALWPSIALAAVATLPTGKEDTVTLPAGRSGMGLRTVESYGIEIKLIGSAEVDFSPDNYGVGLYVDGGFSFQDLNKATEDKYGTYAVGLALPLVMHEGNPLSSPLQLLVETSGTYKRGSAADLFVFTPSLRYVGPVTVTASFHYTAFEQVGQDDGIGGSLQLGLVFP
jgi:hypothetical protein